MTDFKALLLRLHQNLNTLREREARYAGNVPLDLLNQITDHQQAIALTEQAIRGEINEAAWREMLKPMLVSLNVFGPFFAPRAPLQRPPRAPHFTNRKDELARILADLQPGRVVTLCGPGGIGKTALAAEAVWQTEIETRFPDGIIFHSFYNQHQTALALEAIARAFGEEPKPTPRDAALRALAGKQALLLLDGTEEADDLRAVLDVRGGCGAIVTSRKRNDALDERQDVTPMEPDEAVKLLRAWGKDQAADAETAQQICEMVGRLPLAVRLAGRYLDEMGETAGDYLAWLQQTPLEALDQGQRRQQSVPVLLEKSLAQVSEDACQVLGVVGLLALAPFGLDLFAAALDVSPDQLRKPLGELVSYGLLLHSGERYEVSHALIHTYTQEKETLGQETVGRLAGYYTTLAEAESAKGTEGYRRLDVERVHLLRVLAGCAEYGQWEAVHSLVRAVYLTIFYGNWTERVQVFEVGVKATQQLSYRRDEGVFLDNLGHAYYMLGQVERAIEYLEQALAIAREMDDRCGEGDVLRNLSVAYHDLGQVERAIKFYQQALVIAREMDDWFDEVNMLGNLGNAYYSLSQIERAIEYYQQALVIAHEMDDRFYEGNMLCDLGVAYSNLGQIERAIEYYQQALVIAHEMDDRSGEGIALHNIGEIYKDKGNTSLARQYLEQALAIFEEIKSPQAEESRKLLAELEG